MKKGETKMNQTSISVYIDEESKQLIEKAMKIKGLNQSSFCRVSAIKEAREILQQNKSGDKNAIATTI